jgi:hypothetical protein
MFFNVTIFFTINSSSYISQAIALERPGTLISPIKPTLREGALGFIISHQHVLAELTDH